MYESFIDVKKDQWPQSWLEVDKNCFVQNNSIVDGEPFQGGGGIFILWQAVNVHVCNTGVLLLYNRYT